MGTCPQKGPKCVATHTHLGSSVLPPTEEKSALCRVPLVTSNQHPSPLDERPLSISQVHAFLSPSWPRPPTTASAQRPLPHPHPGGKQYLPTHAPPSSHKGELRELLYPLEASQPGGCRSRRGIIPSPRSRAPQQGALDMVLCLILGSQPLAGCPSSPRLMHCYQTTVRCQAGVPAPGSSS